MKSKPEQAHITILLSYRLSLREQVSQLTEALQVKDKQCRHIAAVLHEKNSEWKRIKEKLTGNKRGISESLKNGSIPESVKDEITDIIKNENTKIKKSMEGVEDIKENNTNVNANITVTGTSLDDSTQLPSQRSPSQSPSNHLDTLIDLITDASDTEEEHEQEQQPVHDSNHRTFQEISSRQLQPQMVEGRKRKSHARGCACCEKVHVTIKQDIYVF